MEPTSTQTSKSVEAAVAGSPHRSSSLPLTQDVMPETEKKEEGPAVPSPSRCPSMISGRRQRKPPWGIMWRSSGWYITAVVAIGVMTDVVAYTVVVPVLPYRLQYLQYTNISTLTGWLLFSYSFGIFVCTAPVAYFFAKHPYRISPMIVAVICLEFSLIIFMLIRPYPVMIVSRVIQGASSAVIWSVGFALICENVEEKNLGRQIGFATAGVSIGATMAPPIGGALYFKFGWQAPFIFTIAIVAMDLGMRLLVVEQRHLHKYRDLPPGVVRQVGAKPKPGAGRPAELAPIASPPVDPDAIPGEKAVLNTPGTMETATPPSVHSRARGADDLSSWGVVLGLLKSRRGMTGFAATFIYGICIATLDATLTLRVQAIWNKDSDFVGLVYLARSAPTFVAGPLFGALADKFGAEFIIFPSLILAMPWMPLMNLTSSLAGFIVYFTLTDLCLSAAMAPVGLEITMAARETPGVSEIHQFAAMNIAFAISTSVGAVIGGQMYDHLASGWSDLLWFNFAIIAAGSPLALAFTGNRPLLYRILGWEKPEKPGGTQAEQESVER